jgi:hypothetical protein
LDEKRHGLDHKKNRLSSRRKAGAWIPAFAGTTKIIVIPIKKLSRPRHARAGGHPEFQALPVLLALDSRLRGSDGFLMGMAIFENKKPRSKNRDTEPVVISA